MKRCILLAVLALGGMPIACAEARRAPAPVPARAAASPTPLSAPALPVARAEATPPAEAGSSAPASAPTAPAAAPTALASAPTAPAAAPPAPTLDDELAPALLASDGTPLPQTRDRPRTDSPGFRLRLERLVDAIAHDDPERALPAFFPKVAYGMVKAIPNPGRDWDERLVRAFRRDIHAYHEQLGPDAGGARLEALVVNERAVRWMDPGSEGNRLGYHRVTRSRLQLRLPHGAVQTLELTSLISWRGAWYVVHLHGFS